MLENRMVMRDVFPNYLQDTKLHPLVFIQISYLIV